MILPKLEIERTDSGTEHQARSVVAGVVKFPHLVNGSEAMAVLEAELPMPGWKRYEGGRDYFRQLDDPTCWEFSFSFRRGIG